MANVFAWIFIFQYFYAVMGSVKYAVFSSALLYVLAQDVILLLTPLSAQRLRNGVRSPMVQGVALASTSLIVLGIGISGIVGSSSSLAIIAFALCYGAYRALYWVPYEVDVSRVANGRHLSSLSNEIFFAIVPAVVGIVLSIQFPAQIWMLFITATILAASLQPLAQLPDSHEGFSWSYRRTFHELFSVKHRRLVSASFADGISGAALLFFWPVAAFLIVGWSYAMLGFVVSLTLLIVLAVRYLGRPYIEDFKAHRSALVHATLAASSWILRIVVASPLGIVLVDAYFYTGNAMRGTGIDPFIFEQTADKGSYLDEFTALKEMGLSLGKIVICLIGAFLTIAISLPIAFITVFLIAAVASAASAYLTRSARLA